MHLSYVVFYENEDDDDDDDDDDDERFIKMMRFFSIRIARSVWVISTVKFTRSER